LLATQGVYDFHPLRRDREARLAQLAVPAHLRAELRRQFARLVLVLGQIAELETTCDAVVVGKTPAKDDPAVAKIRKLFTLKSLGPEFSTGLVREVFYRASPIDGRACPGAGRGRQLSGLDRQPVAQRPPGGRAGDQQGRQPARPDDDDRSRLDVAALSARQRLGALVPRARRPAAGRLRRIAIVALARKLGWRCGTTSSTTSCRRVRW
jgi:hypothetical protein